MVRDIKQHISHNKEKIVISAENCTRTHINSILIITQINKIGCN